VKDGNLLADSQYKKLLFYLLGVNNVNDVKQIEMCISEPIVRGLSRLEIETGIAKLRKYKSQVVIKFRQN
jgi:hypothetical protein